MKNLTNIGVIKELLENMVFPFLRDWDRIS